MVAGFADHFTEPIETGVIRKIGEALIDMLEENENISGIWLFFRSYKKDGYSISIFSKITKFVKSINKMNIQAKKLVLIEELLRINDEGFISKLELLIRDEKKKLRQRDLKPLSIDEFHDMIDQSKRDSDAGKVISHDELKKKIKDWE